jgi:N-acetylglucosaminyldiphosphoundecaprenol N-acetyl-beta-D-mannosaminyltransferase
MKLININSSIEKFRMQKYRICNINITSISHYELKNLLEEIINNSIIPQLIVPFNLDCLRIISKDGNFKKICMNSFLNLPDGVGVTTLIKRKYNKNIKRITGNDIFPLLLNIAKTNNLKVAIVGGTDKTSKKVEQRILKEFSFAKRNLLIISPPLYFDFYEHENQKVITTILSFKPDIVFAALGCPRQEKWLYKHMRIFNSKLNIGIGATLDFFAGTKKRSPVFFQRIGLEWTWRLFNEPIRLFKRYIIKDLPFYLKILLRIHEC